MSCLETPLLDGFKLGNMGHRWRTPPFGPGKGLTGSCWLHTRRRCKAPAWIIRVASRLPLATMVICGENHRGQKWDKGDWLPYNIGSALIASTMPTLIRGLFSGPGRGGPGLDLDYLNCVFAVPNLVLPRVTLVCQG